MGSPVIRWHKESLANTVTRATPMLLACLLAGGGVMFVTHSFMTSSALAQDSHIALALLGLCAVVLVLLLRRRQTRLACADLDAPFCGNCGYNLTGNVTNRCPECGMDTARHVAWHLRRREEIRRTKIGVMLVLGAPLSLAGPAAVSTMFWIAGRRLLGLDLGWGDSFIGVLPLILALLFHLELRTGGRYGTDLSGVLGGESHAPARMGLAFGPVAALAVNPGFTASALIEWFLIGPRLIVAALRQLRLSRRLKLSDMQRAAEIVARLLQRSDGLSTSSLLKKDERLDSILPELAYLTFHEWIGAGDRWRRIWLYSDKRRAIEG